MNNYVNHKLSETTKLIQDKKRRKQDKINQIVEEYGSMEAYVAYVTEIKKKNAEDAAEILRREREERLRQEEREAKANDKQLKEAKMRVVRWMDNYTKADKEVLLQEIDLLDEVHPDNVETAVLALI